MKFQVWKSTTIFLGINDSGGEAEIYGFNPSTPAEIQKQ